MLISLLLVLATLSHARPVLLGPFPNSPEPDIIPSLETFPELSDFPIPPLPTFEDFPSFIPSPQIEPSIQPTSLPPPSPTPPFRPPTRKPNLPVSPSPLEINPSLSVSPKPDNNRVSPPTDKTPSKTPTVTPSMLRLDPTSSPTISTTPFDESPTPEDTEEPIQTLEPTDDEPTFSPSPELSAKPTEAVTRDPLATPEPSLPGGASSGQGAGPPELGPTVTPGQRTPCFPALATVQLSDGSIKYMKDLDIGDEVHVGGGKYSPVHMFTHRVYDTWQIFTTLVTSSGRVLKATDGHFVYVGNTLRPARDVRIGDKLPTGEGTWTTVTAIQQVVERGLYNPQTITGDIVVDGIRASVYTEAVKPTIAHAALLPLRVVFSLFGASTQCAHNGYPEIVPHALRNMVAVAK